jgi:hypothetical protein
MSQLVSEHYGCNTSHTTLFSKTTVRIRLDAHIRNVVVLIGKKVSILPPGDVNPGPVPSRRGLLENCPYRATWS